MSKKYDLIIVGAGPAGIFLAIELVKLNVPLKVLLLDKGKELEERSSLISGWGGAGAFSDGKLTLSPEIGGYLKDFLGQSEAQKLIDYVDSIYLEFGAPKEIYGGSEDESINLSRQAAKANMRFIPSRIRHLGTENCRTILKSFHDFLQWKIEIRTELQVEHVLMEGNRVKGVQTTNGEILESNFVVLAPGREGAHWLAEECRLLNLSLARNPVDVGVRIEVPAVILEPLTRSFFEAKLEYFTKSFDDRVRTFCMCPYGEVAMETSEGVVTVNGHSYANHKTENSNFAILVSTRFTDPFKEPISYGRSIAGLANLLGGNVILQRLGDLKAGRRSTKERIAHSIISPTLKEATPGDLSFVLPYRHLTDILEMIEALDALVPGISSMHTLLYGVEVKFYSSRPKLSPVLETEIKNLFSIGDGAGVSRGLVQASASGVLVAKEIAKRVNLET